MKVIPHFVADFDEYPELRTLADAALRRVVELMSIHGIAEIRRMKKTGVFDHPYDKDVVTPVDVPTMPHTVRAGGYAAGVALLDYVEAIGMSGVSLELTREDVQAMAALWAPPRPAQPAQSLDPVLVPSEDAPGDERSGTAAEPERQTPETSHKPKPANKPAGKTATTNHNPKSKETRNGE